MDAIAAFGLHGALVVGTPVAVRDIDDCVAKLRSFTVVLSRDGREEAAGGGADVLDSPLLAFAHLAEMLGRQARFAPVQAGAAIAPATARAMREPVAPFWLRAASADGRCDP